jgi:hypothetical protein
MVPYSNSKRNPALTEVGGQVEFNIYHESAMSGAEYIDSNLYIDNSAFHHLAICKLRLLLSLSFSN